MTLEEALYWPQKEDMPFIWCQTNPVKKLWVDGWQQIDFTNFDFMNRNYAEAKRGNRIINGIALVLGQTIHKAYYTFALDFDGWDAVLAWFGSWENVLSLAQKTRIEWHGDKGHIHVLFKSKNYLGDGKNCRIEDIGPNKEKIEIRIERQLLFSWPSIHPSNKTFTPIGTEKILELSPSEMYKVWDKIRRLSAEYTSNVNRRKYIQDIERRYDMNTGQGIHYALVDLAVTYYLGLYGECKGLDDKQRKIELEKWATKQNRNSQKEIDGVWEWVERTFKKDSEESRAKWEKVEQPNDKKTRPLIPTYKYSKNKKENLHEAIIINDKPVFLVYDDTKTFRIDFPVIEEETRIIIPPDRSEYAYDPYEFESLNEVNSYMERAKNETIETLYWQCKKIVNDYTDFSIPQRRLLVINILWSYFQDRFPTCHYDVIIGLIGSGKSTYGIVFTSTGYRVVMLTNPNGANIMRILGKVEASQCTLVCDEVKHFEKNPELLSILSTGYDIKGKSSKVHDTTRKPEFFKSYGYKMILANRMSNVIELEGFADRCFKFTAFRGNPKFDIKETLEPQGNKARQERLDTLTDFRKLMLVYRMMHYKDEIPDINVGFSGRDKELVKPLIQLFYGSKVQEEIEETLQVFLDARNEKRGEGLEPIFLEIIGSLLRIDKTIPRSYIKHKDWKRDKNELYVNEIWNTFKIHAPGNADRNKPNEWHTEEFGTVYNNTLRNILENTFGGKPDHRSKGNTFRFDPDALEKISASYRLKSTIRTKREGCEGCEGSIEGRLVSMKAHEDTLYISKNNNNNNAIKRVGRKKDRLLQTPQPSMPSQKCYYCTWNEVCTQDEFKAHLEKCAEIERARLK